MNTDRSTDSLLARPFRWQIQGDRDEELSDSGRRDGEEGVAVRGLGRSGRRRVACSRWQCGETGIGLGI